MFKKAAVCAALAMVTLGLAGLGAWYASRPTAEPGEEYKEPPVAEVEPSPAVDPLEERFSTHVRPFLERYCVSCHGPKKHKGGARPQPSPRP